MGAIMKSAMKKAKVKKPTFPGPRAGELLNKKVQKLKDRGANKPYVMESHADIDARINRKILKDFKPGHDFKSEKKALKKILDKKKGKDLDWGDVKKSHKIFTRK